MKRAILVVLVSIIGAVAQFVPAFAQFDQYGGWTSLSGSNSSGYFRVEKIDNRYWFVTPDNHVYWLSGVCWGTYLPTSGHVYAWPCPQLGYSPEEINERAKFNNTEGTWTSQTQPLLESFGINTQACGSWNDLLSFPDTFEIVCATGLAMSWYSWANVPPYNDVAVVTDGFVDVFNPTFDVAADDAANCLDSKATDPYRIGSFPDSELRWNYGIRSCHHLADNYIAQDCTTYAKQHWLYDYICQRFSYNLDWYNYVEGPAAKDANGDPCLFTSWDGPECSSVINTRVIADDPAYPYRAWDKELFVDNFLLPPDPDPYDSSPHVGLPDAFITLPAQCPGKQFWVQLLIDRHLTLANLNTSWGTSFTSWSGTEETSVANAPMIADSDQYPDRYSDKQAFIWYIVDTYYDKVTTAMRDHDPNHLIFSDRFTSAYEQSDDPYTWMYNNIIFEVAGDYCDVLTANTYRDTINLETSCSFWGRMFTYSGRPIMISENAYFANDGLCPDKPIQSPEQTATQMERANAYKAQFQWAVDYTLNDPNGGGSAYPWVGQTWFDLIDCPPLGTDADGGGAHGLGLLNVMSEPYTVLQDMMGTVHSQVYDRKANGTAWSVMSAPSLSSPSDNATLNSPTPAFSWSSVSGASDYVLLISPEKSFPGDQTIRVNAGSTSYTYNTGGGLSRGEWYWTVAAKDGSGKVGAYAPTRQFTISTASVSTVNNRTCEEVTGWVMMDNTDSGGDGTVYVFRDTQTYCGGTSSARLVFDINGYNKTTQTKNIGQNWLQVELRPGEIDYSGYANFQCWFYPHHYSDWRYGGNLASASIFLGLQVYDATNPNTPVIETWVDPNWLMTMDAWNDLTVPFGAGSRSRIDRIVFRMYTGWVAAWDQRLVFNVDDIIPR